MDLVVVEVVQLVVVMVVDYWRLVRLERLGCVRVVQEKLRVGMELEYVYLSYDVQLMWPLLSSL